MNEVQRLKFPVFEDARGRVVPVEHLSPDLPFVPVRTFVICDVPDGQSRARHTLTCHQLLIVTSGSLIVTVRNGNDEASYTLDAPGAGLFVPEGRWIVLRNFASGTVLLVFASKSYNRD